MNIVNPSVAEDLTSLKTSGRGLPEKLPSA